MEKTWGNLKIEHFSIECRKTETKVITTANQNKGNIFRSQWELGVKTTALSRARESAGDQAVIDWESVAVFWTNHRAK